jgi:hypothetical protein
MSFADEFRSDRPGRRVSAPEWDDPRPVQRVAPDNTTANMNSITQSIRQLAANITKIRQLTEQVGTRKDSLEGRQTM